MTCDPWPWNSIRFRRLSKYMFVQNVIKLSAAIHDCYRANNLSLPYLAMVKNSKIRSCDSDLWSPGFERVSSGCQGTCSCKISSSCVQRFMRYCANRGRQTPDENNTVRHCRADSKNSVDYRHTVPSVPCSQAQATSAVVWLTSLAAAPTCLGALLVPPSVHLWWHLGAAVSRRPGLYWSSRNSRCQQA